MVKDVLTPVGLLSGIARPTVRVPEEARTSAPTSVHVWDRATAAAASTAPKPYLWFTQRPEPFCTQSASVGSFRRADSTSTC